MPEVTIAYEKPETLKMLKDMAKRFDFKVLTGKAKKSNTDDMLTPEEALKKTQNKPYKIKGVTILPATEKFDSDDLTDLFTKNNIDAAQLRKEAWQRKS